MAAQKGFAHAAASRIGHKAGRWLARTVCNMPTVQSILAVNKEAATFVSEFVAGGTDAIEIPGDNFFIQLLNRTIEATASESAELIAEFQKDPSDRKAEMAVIEAIEKKLDEALSVEVWLFGTVYAWEKCPHFTKPQNSRSLKRGEAMMLGYAPINCACHGTVLKDIPAAPKGKQSFIGILAELDGNDADVIAFRFEVLKDKELRDKLIAAVKSGISKSELMFIISHKKPGWSPLLGALVGEPDPLVKKWDQRFSGFIEKTLARWDERMSREKDENERAARRLHRWFDSFWEENEETERRQPVRKRNGWKAFTIVFALAMTVGGGLYLITYNHDRSQPQQTESSNGR